MYDNAGHLLFSVNSSGIYKPSGAIAYDFRMSGFTKTVTIGGVDHTFTPLDAASEVVIFPCTKSATNNSYYVVFWAHDAETWGSTIDPPIFELRAIKVQVNPANGNLSFVDDVMYDQTSGNGMIRYTYDFVYKFAIAADAADCGDPRNIYTLEPGTNTTGWVGTKYVSTLRKWTFGASGSLPSPTTSTYIAEIKPAYSNKAKIFTISGDKYLGFITGEDAVGSAAWCPHVGLSKLSDGAMTTYGLTGEYKVTGFEYVPSRNFLYLSYRHYTTAGYDATGSGLLYFDLASPSGTGIPSTNNYASTDLELSKNGNLYLVKGAAATTSDDGALAYLPVSSTTYSPSTDAPIEVLKTEVSCTTNVSVASFVGHRTSEIIPYYLGSQIRGEDYGDWKMPSYNITGAETWTPTNNPIADMTGSTVSIMDVKNITIQPGASLTIRNMTIKMASDGGIDVFAAGSSGIGGKLVIDHSIITGYYHACDPSSVATMWWGIHVWGNPTRSQSPLGSSAQGYLNMINNSEISKSKAGVFCGQVSPSGVPAFTGWGVVAWPFLSFTGGGIVRANDSKFYNNNCSGYFWPYRNFNPLTPATEVNNLSYFSNCKFESDDAAYVPSGTMIDVGGWGVKGIRIIGCEFVNNMGMIPPSYGVQFQDANFVVDQIHTILPSGGTLHIPSSFSRFTHAIDHVNTATSTAAIRNTTFNDNVVGIYLKGSFAPVVVDNVFNVPFLYTYLSSTSPFSTAIGLETTGLMLFGAHTYTVHGNKFHYSSVSHFPMWGVTNSTVGVNAWNTQFGLGDNLINNNEFKGLGYANLAVFKNRENTLNGLWYKCNEHSGSTYDISVMGNDPIIQGIKIDQGTPSTSTFSGVASGNTFTKSSSPTVYNLYSGVGIAPFHYVYSSAGNVLEKPGVPGVTANTYGTYTFAVTPLANCTIPGDSWPDGGFVRFSGGGRHVGHVSANMGETEKYQVVISNINYYLNDSTGVPNRDSVYYFVKQLDGMRADLMTSYLLLEDGYIDSATGVYDSIVYKYAMDSTDSVETAVYGRQVFELQKSVAMRNVIFKKLVTEQLDSVTTDSLMNARMFDETARTAAIDIYNGSRYWPHVIVENILRVYDSSLLDSLVTVRPDTILYPSPMDSVVADSFAKGVLLVTEISQGPAPDCQYIELMVANCGVDASRYVDVRGWIVDDNSGNFNPEGCGDASAGITAGHYRLNPELDMWKHIAVGSVIVIYNTQHNCYSLSDTFFVDSVNSVYWIPVHDDSYETDIALQSWEGDAECSFCAPEQIFVNVNNWSNHVLLDHPQDGVQVRCPGCSGDSQPAFYHGIGYTSYDDGSWSPISPSSSSVGSALTFNNGTEFLKYEFTGSAVGDLDDASFWAVAAADSTDSAYLRPASLGYVNTVFFEAVVGHELNFPCCGEGGANKGASVVNDEKDSQPGQSSPKAISAGKVRVYPNPAYMMLNFEFPLSGTVTIKLTDITGRKMDEKVVSNKTTAAFNVKGYAPGLYLYQITTNGKTTSGKVMISE